MPGSRCGLPAALPPPRSSSPPYRRRRLRAHDRERLNPRSVVTNLTGKPRRIYERGYCYRGDAESRIQELSDVAFDRTRCSRLLANHFCVLIAAAAYALQHQLQLAAPPGCARRLPGRGSHCSRSVCR